MGTVYRAFDRLNRQTVALKRVRAATDKVPTPAARGLQSTTDTRVALAHEFQTLASLHHPHIITVLDYGFDAEHQPYFTMNLLENARTLIQAGEGQPLENKVNLLIQTLQALAYLHRRGVVHRDLKPDNALVTSAGEVRVLDFGLAVLREQHKTEPDVAGTLAYMAPEVLQGKEVTESADLYAVGMMGYELLTGSHPFDTKDIIQLIQDVLSTPVDVSVLDVDWKLASTLQRLVDKSPGDRYQTAYEVIIALSEAIDRPPPEETSAIRESFLQAAQFVGRDREFGLLTEALSQAAESQGRVWLVGGESGVGKSRLVDELRVRALVRGALVLHGQAVADSGLPYQLWRSPLRRLVLSTELNDFDASVLKQIVPDIGELLERDIPDAPELEGQAGQQRLLQAMLDVFRRQTRPLVLILEDLQWAVESLDVLKWLIPMVQELPLLIVGSYRDDERPNLPEELPGAQVIRLERLSDDGISQLSISMLGESGQHPKVLEFLKRETEGNVFFLVEVVRALAEEAGGLTEVGRKTLPEHIIAGGVQQVVQRRLNRVSESARGLLKLAAILGRQLDLAVLRALDSQMDIDGWLTECASAAVLDIMEERWRFAHEKLREGLLRTLPEDERRELNRSVALALEQAYADELDEYAAIIAEHYERAGELGPASVWYGRAGKRAQATYAPVAAIGYYRKALDYGVHSTDPQETQLARQVEVYGGLGPMLYWQARYAEAAEVFTTMRTAAETVGDRLAQANAWRGVALTQMQQGDFRATLESLSHAEEIMRAADARLDLADVLLMRAWSLFALGEMEEALTLGEQVLALSEEAGYQARKAQGLNLMGVVNGTQGRYQQAVHHFERALETFEEVGDRASAMFLVNNLGVLASQLGDYRKAFERFQDAVSRAREMAHRDGEMLAVSNQGGARVALGEYVEAEADLRQVIQMAETSGFGQLSETYRFLAEAVLGQGKAAAAVEAARRALTLGKEIGSPEFIAAAWRVLGQIAAYLSARVFVEDSNSGQVVGHDAPACFAESMRICQETGMEGERARTLKAWAQHELKQGDQEKGKGMWQEAREVFQRIGAELEAQRMSQAPAQPS